MISDEAYVLHKIKYKNSSEIIKLLTKNEGRIDAVAKGSRRAKSAFKGHLQPFIKTTVTYQGRQSLKTLTQAEQSELCQVSAYLNQVALLYCNELLLLLNMGEEQATAVYPIYHQTIQSLQAANSVSLHLRYFEWSLFALSGYGLSLKNDLADDTSLVFQADQGLVASHSDTNCDVLTLRHFIARQSLTKKQLQAISRLFKPVVNHLVGGRAIRSRELLQKSR